MPAVSIHIAVSGLREMADAFERLATQPAPAAKLDAALTTAFAGTQAAVPVDQGDSRRPAGALRDSGRMTSEAAEDWSGEIAYGTETDVLPYAQWARWKHLDKDGTDWFGDPIDATADEFLEAYNSYFDDAVGI